jgi:protein transport protein HofB
LGKEHREALINKVKWLTNLDLSISGRPQDGRATYYGLHLNLRVNAIPTRHGDKIVIRILDQDKEFDIHKSGLPENVVEDLIRIANLPNGLLIISGPTGSGKTTTLYGLINSLDHERRNITTLEDPSEYELQGVTQTEIGKNLSFASALKALLRQDPDVILLGEIRDEETARLSFKIANTGHLVITTLHSNGAIESIERLKTMGIDPFSIESCLRLTGAQRLVKKLCPSCSTSVSRKHLSQDEESLGPLEEKLGRGNYRQKNNEGCDKCTKGIIGRLPVLEYATHDEIHSYFKGSARSLRTSLKEATFKHALEGRVDIHEALSVA